MKIVCDACQAKYSISDDKVQGKVFKIRCKKCSNIIVVRGGASAAEAPAPAAQEKDTRVYDYGYDGAAGGGEEAVWHVVINQDQVGPMTAAEVQQRFSAGEIDAETYAWREGFADWLPLSQVDTFAAFVAAGSTTSAAGGGGAAAVSSMSSMFGGNDESGTVRSDPGDLFAAASAGASSRSHEDDGDLFGSKPSKSSSTSANAAAEAKLRGERNENSVLFSLNNLAQLASDKPAPNAGVSSMPSGHATGAAGGEGSGLIDIRSMANAYLGGAGAAGAKTATASSGIGSIDDLPVFGGGGFSEPAVIVPTASRGQNNKMMYALIGSVAFLAIAAVIMIVVLLKGGGEKVVVAANDTKGSAETKDKDEVKDPDTKSETPTANAGSADEAPTNTGSAESPPTTDPGAAEPAKTEEPKTTEPKKTEPKKTEPKKTTTQVARTEPKKTEPKKVEAPVKDTGGCDEVSCVLNNYEGACCAKFKKKSSGGSAPKSGGSSNLPDALDRAMISEGVNKVKARVQSCGDRSSAKGQVKVSVKVNPGGDVASVTVKNTPDASLGSCVASAMQKARFAKTQNGGSFGYPFMF